MRTIVKVVLLVVFVAVVCCPVISYAKTINFSGKLREVAFDNGNGIFSNTPLNSIFVGMMDDENFNGDISDVKTKVSFSCCLAAGGLDIIDNHNLVLDANAAAELNQAFGTSFSVGNNFVDLVNIEGDQATASNGRIEVGITYVLADDAFENEDPNNYPFDSGKQLFSFFWIFEEDSNGNDIYQANGFISDKTIFTDRFDDPDYTERYWTIGTPAVPQEWTFPLINGTDLGYQGSRSLETAGLPASKSLTFGDFFVCELDIEVLLKIDQYANALTTENTADIVFSVNETAYAAGIQIDYDPPETPEFSLYLYCISGETLAEDQHISLDFDTFYRLAVHIDKNQTATVNLYNNGNNSPIASINSPLSLSQDYGTVGISAKDQATFNNFYILGRTVPPNIVPIR